MARLDELERKFEENPRRYFAPLANEYRKAGDAQRAADLCRAQLPEVPGHISGHIVLGQALFDAREFAGARAALETALGLDPENIVALRYLGDIARETGDVAEAERWYMRTLEADPYNDAASSALEAMQQKTAASAAESPAAYDQQPPTQTHQEITAGSGPIAEPPAPDNEQPLTQTHQEIDAPSAPLLVPEVASEFEPTGYASPDFATSEEPKTEPADSVAEELTAAESSEQTVIGEAHEDMGATEQPASDQPEGQQFSGDLEISAAHPEPEAPVAAEELIAEEPVTAEESATEETVAAEEPVPSHEPTAEPAGFPEEAAVVEPAAVEPAETEERVLEAAAPFVTETMADLYLEQGYPHEALELLLQLSEQRPGDESLRAKIEHIEEVIVARRDAAVAAARAERIEQAEAEQVEQAEQPDRFEHVEPAGAADALADALAAEPLTDETQADEMPADESPADEPSADAPFDPAVAEVDASAFAASAPAEAELDSAVPHEPEPQFTPDVYAESVTAQPLSVRELFARMDRARPRAPGALTAKPIARLRSDFVAMPEQDYTDSETDESPDPFGFPDAEPPVEQRRDKVARSSGPHPIFNPSTADIEDFDAWLRGLKGP